MPSPKPPGVCSECMYWRQTEYPIGRCYLHPPTVVTTAGEDASSFGVSIRPETGAKSFCSHWREDK